MPFKRIFSLLLSVVMVVSMGACNDASKDASKTDVAQTTQEIQQNPDEVTPRFSNYQDILNAISLLHSAQKEGALNDTVDADQDERESAIYNSLSHFICGGSGYCIKDINHDGIDELIMLTEAWELKGLFTLKDGLPVLIEICANGGIGKDGKIRLEYIEETSEGKKTVYRLKTFTEGVLITEVEFEETDFYDDAKEDEYYQIINGERVKKGYYDLINLRIEYSFRDYRILTDSAEIECTRLLDIPVLRNRGNYFSLSTLNNPTGSYTYFLEVYDKDGNTVLSYEDSSIYVYEIQVNDQETLVSIYYGHEKNYFYNVLENRFSEPFYGENVLAVSGRLIAYVSEEENEKCIVVQDIFDTGRFYQSYDHEAVKHDTPSAWFSQDGKSITLKYRLADAKNDTTKVLCFEKLPILKTKQICYVRCEASTLSDFMMASSGVRSVLRADTNDTIRLLSDGAIIGGEYTSNDGTVRNDWYCIDYKGYICYVTADSFEVED